MTYVHYTATARPRHTRPIGHSISGKLHQPVNLELLTQPSSNLISHRRSRLCTAHVIVSGSSSADCFVTPAVEGTPHFPA
jgi:hypothetical protein